MMAQDLRPTRAQLTDLFWRALWTFLQAFLGVLTGASLFDWDVAVWEAGLAAGVGAVLSLVKTFAAQRLQRDPEPLPTVEHETPGMRVG